MTLSADCFNDDCDWCVNPVCDCDCHDEDRDLWGDEGY